MSALFKIPDIGSPPPWETLPRELMGDSAKEEIYQAVGAALSTWELLDNQQTDLFSTIVGSRQRGAEAAYGTVSSSIGRTAMITAAADRAFARSSPDLLNDITVMVERIGKLAARRNDIAHGVAWGFNAHGKDLGYYLIPAPYNTRRYMTTLQVSDAYEKATLDEIINNPFGFGPNKYAYRAHQIAQYTKHFEDYKSAMMKLVEVVKATCDALFP